MITTKKEFQKMVAHIRVDLNEQRKSVCEYPKAMMTAQQMAKRTATINCWRSSRIAEAVLAHPAIIAFLRSHGATAAIEETRNGSWTQHQIRINFPTLATTEQEGSNNG